MTFQPIRRWWCFSNTSDLDEWAAGSETYCRFGRHGEHTVACGWKVLVNDYAWTHKAPVLFLSTYEELSAELARRDALAAVIRSQPERET